jgi:hypothetical protein
MKWMKDIVFDGLDKDQLELALTNIE